MSKFIRVTCFNSDEDTFSEAIINTKKIESIQEVYESGEIKTVVTISNRIGRFHCKNSIDEFSDVLI